MSQIIETLKALAENLPLIAEEGNFTNCRSKAEISLSIVESTGQSPEFVSGVLELQQQYWSAMGLLEPSQLAKGLWQFTSFPSSLAARSLLETVQSEKPQLFERGWWTNENFVEDQRNFLIELEDRRMAYHSSEKPNPIRHVQVAWALIKLDGMFLMNHREDNSRNDVPNYVFIGGRLNLHDLLERFQDEDETTLLQWHQGANWPKIEQALPITLKRELQEELGFYPKHYLLGKAHRIQSYEKMEGARANHTLTRYDIVAYEIELTDVGFRHLCRYYQMSSDEKLIYVTPEEIAAGQKEDKKLFVNAWTEQIGGKKLQKLLADFTESYSKPAEFSEAFDIPVSSLDRIQKGILGRERPVDLELGEAETEILQAMAWHRIHGERFPMISNGKTFYHAKGWIEIERENTEHIELIRQLSRKLREKGLPIIQGDQEGWFRLGPLPEQIFFQDQFFILQPLQLDTDIYVLHLDVEQTETPLGTIPATVLEIASISKNLYLDLKLIIDGADPHHLGDIQKSLREQINQGCRAVGLRLPVRLEDNHFITNCRSA